MSHTSLEIQPTEVQRKLSGGRIGGSEKTENLMPYEDRNEREAEEVARVLQSAAENSPALSSRA